MDDLFEAQVDEMWAADGFFSKLRHLEFDASSGRKALEYFKAQDISSVDDYVRFVKRSYHIPLFIRSWETRAVERGADSTEYANLTAAFFDVIHEKIMGFSLDETGEAAG
ncbi:MAG: hypothetical protein AAFR71_08570 [Pseudomonadota bacterium]